VDLDVRMPLANRDLLPEERELERTGIEVEELRQDLDVRALPHEEDRHDGGDHRDRAAAIEEEPEIGLDPSLRDHDVAPVPLEAPSGGRPAPPTRSTSPSEPTASPAPVGAIDTVRIQFAASWMGSGSIAHVAPPSVVLRTVPASPTIQPFEPRI